MSARMLYRKVREKLVDWGLVSKPRFYLRRQPVGAVRARLTGRGRARRIRRLSLPQLLREQPR